MQSRQMNQTTLIRNLSSWTSVEKKRNEREMHSGIVFKGALCGFFLLSSLSDRRTNKKETGVCREKEKI